MVKVVAENTQEGNYLVLTLKSLTVSVDVPIEKYHMRKAEMELVTPDNKVTRIALPLNDGSGPQPENSLTMIVIQDKIREMMLAIEQVLSEPVTKKEEEKAW